MSFTRYIALALGSHYLRRGTNAGDARVGFRRTGITLKEGKRDEHGMEEIEGMFSSPEKSPANENGFDNNGNETVIGSDGMSLDEGTPISPPPSLPFEPAQTSG